MSTRKRLLTIVGILVGAIVIARVMIMLRPEPPRRPAEPEAPLVTVEAVSLGSGPLPVYGGGTVRPRSEVAVTPQVGGRIAWVSPALQSGGAVVRNQLLLRIDPADYENRRNQARAGVAAQQVALLQAEEEARLAEEEVQQFLARERLRGGDPAQPSTLALREPQLEAARAALAQAEATLADAELALSRTEVRSPFDGRVRMENADVGAFVSPGQSLGQIYASDAVEVVVPIDDDDALQIPGLWEMSAGDGDSSIRARVTTAFGTRRYSWEGYVDRAETALDEQSRTIDVVVRVPDPFRPGTPEQPSGSQAAPPLLVGQYAEVEIEAAAPPEYFVVPRRALRPGGEVWAVGPDETLRIVPVEVLQESDEEVFVIGTLADQQDVVVAGIEYATEGMVVRVVRPEGGGQ